MYYSTSNRYIQLDPIYQYNYIQYIYIIISNIIIYKHLHIYLFIYRFIYKNIIYIIYIGSYLYIYRNHFIHDDIAGCWGPEPRWPRQRPRRWRCAASFPAETTPGNMKSKSWPTHTHIRYIKVHYVDRYIIYIY